MTAGEGAWPREPAPDLQPSRASRSPVGPADLRSAFRRHAAGVAIITAGTADAPIGFTATSLVSVSADPPMISFNVARGSSSWPGLSVARQVGVHVLAEAQEALATLFATSGADRFGAPTRWSPGPYGVPVLDGCAVWLIADVEQRVAAGDHVIVVARVLHIESRPGRTEPLLYHDGRYRRADVRPALRLLDTPDPRRLP